ncbi:MAG TPA: TonB-dependent receptor [Alteraurantiacibacter sp.]
MRQILTRNAPSVQSLLLAGVASIGLALPAAANAQEEELAQPAPPSTENENATGNEIIVTATKREATLQDVPVAVSVTTSETLERAQIRDLRDLQTVVPSLSVGQRQSVANTNFFIRGFGNGANNAGIEPSVGVFVDNVYRSRTAAQITDLPDVQRIEVLRGPQSTLFGKNASAGVISIVTQEPQFDFGGSLEATYGNYNQIIGKGHVTGPLGESVAASLAAGFNKRDGFFEDLGTGEDTNERNRWFARGQLLFEPVGGDLKVRIIGDYDKIDEDCCGVVNLQSSAATGAVIGVGGQVTDPSDPFADVVYTNYGSSNEIENYGISGQIDYNIGLLTLTSITAYRKTDSFTDQDSDFTSADLLDGQTVDLGIQTFTQELRVSGEVGNMFSFLLGAFYLDESIDQTGTLFYGPAFRPYANLLVQGASGGALNIPTLEGAFSLADMTNYMGTFFAQGSGFSEAYTLDTQSISLFGQVDFEIADGLVLTLGGNYTKDSKTFATDTVSTDVFSSIDLDAPQYAPFRQQLLVAGGLQQAGVNPTDPAAVFAFATNPATAPIYNGIVAFAAANANNPAANPLGELRGFQFLPPFLNVPNAVEDGEIDDDNFSYTIRLAYDISPEVNIYASYATGFKASSVNLSRDSRPFPGDQAAIEAAGLSLNNLTYTSRFAGPEESRVIEGGIKWSVDGFSGALTVFDQEIDGFQSNLFTGTGFALLNAGKQSTLGVEFEGQMRTGGLTLTGGVTYLDPVYDDFQISAVGDLSGRRPSDIPEWTIVVGAQYEFEVGNDLIIPRVSFLHQSEVQLVDGLPGFLIDLPGGGVDTSASDAAAAMFTRQTDDLTASISYECDCGVVVSIWGRNLLDDREIGTIFDSVAQPLGISGYANDPRTYGATVRYKW